MLQHDTAVAIGVFVSVAIVDDDDVCVLSLRDVLIKELEILN